MLFEKSSANHWKLQAPWTRCFVLHGGEFCGPFLFKEIRRRIDLRASPHAYHLRLRILSVLHQFCLVTICRPKNPQNFYRWRFYHRKVNVKKTWIESWGETTTLIDYTLHGNDHISHQTGKTENRIDSKLYQRWEGMIVSSHPKTWPLKNGYFEDPKPPLRNTGSFTLPLEGPWGFLGQLAASCYLLWDTFFLGSARVAECPIPN